MPSGSVKPVAILVALLLPGAAQAACALSGLSPVPGGVATSRPTFMFVQTADCTASSVILRNPTITRTPVFVRAVGPRKLMAYTPTAAEWGARTTPGRASVDWA